MANARKKRRSQPKDKRVIWVYIAAILIFAFIFWLEYHNAQMAETQDAEDSFHLEVIPAPESSSSNYNEEIESGNGLLNLHMIDCGQGDSFLFEQSGKYALIDCGTRSTGKNVVEYLQKEGVTELQFIVGTHPHDDHMGGMEEVLKNFKCNQIYMPKVDSNLVTTNWYLSLMKKIKQDKLKVTNLKVYDNFMLGDACFTVVGQLTAKEAGDNLNNYSTVIKVSMGDMDILMTGDAETPVESKMLANNMPIDCEILKLGHHGSTTSSSKKFLQAVSPEVAIVSCGIGNKYNHPCEETLNKLEQDKIPLYRTDENGDVVITISLEDITFHEPPGDYIDGPTLAKMKGVS